MSLDELAEFGMERMTDTEIRTFLSSQRVGVLSLPATGAPYQLPLSYGFDGESTLYFTYVLGTESRKADLTDAAETAGFLVYRADSAFNWESVSLTGPIEELPESAWDDVQETLSTTWRPSLFETAATSLDASVYRLRIERMQGIKHTGLPDGFQPRSSDDGGA